MTGGSRSRFFISFALGQLKAYRKGGYNNKLSPKSGSKWTITSIVQKTDSPPEDDVNEDVSDSEESESVKNIEGEEDSFDDDSDGSSSSGNNDGTYKYTNLASLLI